MQQLINLLGESSPLLIQGALMTFKLWISASCVSIVAGTAWGIIQSNHLRIAVVSSVIDVFTFIFRAIPFYVQLLMIYFILPTITKIPLSATTASFISLGLCSGGYISQIVKGGINAIPIGQWEAAQLLGYSKINTIRYIIMPQAIQIVLPGLIGECDQLLKSTSVVSAIGVLELTGAAKNIIAQEMNPLAIYTSLGLIYLCMSSLLLFSARLVERKLSV